MASSREKKGLVNTFMGRRLHSVVWSWAFYDGSTFMYFLYNFQNLKSKSKFSSKNCFWLGYWSFMEKGWTWSVETC